MVNSSAGQRGIIINPGGQIGPTGGAQFIYYYSKPE
jgi:hypothetical protein